jgi:hypothetical protein
MAVEGAWEKFNDKFWISKTGNSSRIQKITQ